MYTMGRIETSVYSTRDLCRFVQDALRKRADPAKAVQMAAYMKTDMPFYGVQKPDRDPIYRTLQSTFVPGSLKAYADSVAALWELPHREEKYAAIEFAIRHRKFITLEAMPLYERLIREGAWWDLVDPVATVLVGRVLIDHRVEAGGILEQWVGDGDMWIRRAAILAHLKHKDKTDVRQLFAHCLRLSGEKEFFIRKAIGWALREYAKTAPVAVSAFLRTHRDALSPLSLREASKHLPA
ncbi:MAG TPA: DNA alkylation repair protein [Noviherbaspirillum sp.]|nr:DNA alkylation repair protein [Noviherbaspirillum sp.]